MTCQLFLWQKHLNDTRTYTRTYIEIQCILNMHEGYYITISIACVSAFVSFLACTLYFLYERKSRLLLMITLLLVSDGLISLAFVVWALTDLFLTTNDDLYCRIWLPFQNFFFLSSFGFTILIAQRFMNVNKLQAGIKLENTTLWSVPLVSGVLTVPIIVLNVLSKSSAVGELISPNNKDVTFGDFCYFSSKRDSFIVNALCLQLPSLLTIAYNAYAYFTGVQLLNQSSAAVSIDIYIS